MSTCEPTNGVMKFILPVCSTHLIVCISSRTASVDVNSLRCTSSLCNIATYVRSQDESHKVNKHSSSLAALGPCPETVVPKRSLLQREALHLLVTHAVVVHCLQGIEVLADGPAREEAGRQQHRVLFFWLTSYDLTVPSALKVISNRLNLFIVSSRSATGSLVQIMMSSSADRSNTA